MKLILSLFLFLSLPVLSQTEETGYYKLSKLKADKNDKPGKVNLAFHFQGPDGKPAKSQVKFAMNRDTIKPTVDESGSFSIKVKPGKYKFVFFTPGWFDIATDSVAVENSPLSFFVHFEAKELHLSELKTKSK